MEVLQVKGIVPGLVDIISRKCGCTNLELNGNQGGATNQHGIDAGSKPWHLELENDCAGETLERILKDVDRGTPCGHLCGSDVKGALPGQDTDDPVGFGKKERVDGR